jgi:hypothetical protein
MVLEYLVDRSHKRSRGSTIGLAGCASIIRDFQPAQSDLGEAVGGAQYPSARDRAPMFLSKSKHGFVNLAVRILGHHGTKGAIGADRAAAMAD